MRCSHIRRLAVGHGLIAGVSIEQCERECFPDLVLCYEHASKESLAQLARNAMRERDQALIDLRREREVSEALARRRP